MQEPLIPEPTGNIATWDTLKGAGGCTIKEVISKISYNETRHGVAVLNFKCFFFFFLLRDHDCLLFISLVSPRSHYILHMNALRIPMQFTCDFMQCDSIPFTLNALKSHFIATKSSACTTFGKNIVTRSHGTFALRYMRYNAGKRTALATCIWGVINIDTRCKLQLQCRKRVGVFRIAF